MGVVDGEGVSFTPVTLYGQRVLYLLDTDGDGFDEFVVEKGWFESNETVLYGWEGGNWEEIMILDSSGT